MLAPELHTGTPGQLVAQFFTTELVLLLHPSRNDTLRVLKRYIARETFALIRAALNDEPAITLKRRRVRG